MQLLLIFLFVFASSNAFGFGGTCPAKDLNAIEDSPLQHMSIQNQSGSALCYAYTASAQADFYRYRHRAVQNPPISSPPPAGWETDPLWTAHVAVLNRRNLDQSGAGNYFDGGWEDNALDALRRFGICNSSEMRVQWSQMKQSTGLDDAQLLQALELLHRNYGYNPERLDFLRNATRRELNSVYQQYLEATGDRKRQLQRQLARLYRNFRAQESQFASVVDQFKGRNPAFRTCNFENLAFQVLKHNFLDNPPVFTLGSMFDGCRPKAMGLRTAENVRTGDDSNIRRQIDYAFNMGYPPAVSLCSSVFGDTSYRGLGSNQQPRDAASNMANDCAYHAVLVVARREKNGECQLQLRNSWGTPWYPEGASSCACRKNAPGGGTVYQEDCAEGEPGVREFVGCWFHEDAILANTGSVNVYH